MALMQLDFLSETLGMGMSLHIICPEGCLRRRDGPLSVLYLLHGMGDDHTAWLRYTGLERYLAGTNLVAVMPSTHLGAYANQPMGHRYFDYITEELPALCAGLLPISPDRERSFIGGLSMGGYGALKAGLRHPDRYASVVALSAGVDRLATIDEALWDAAGFEDLERLRPDLSPEAYAAARHFMGSFGSPRAYRQSEEENLFLLAEQCAGEGMPLPRLWITCGTEDAGALEPNRRFHRHLEELRVPHRYGESPGTHNWDFWDAQIRAAIPWLLSGSHAG